MTGCVATPTPGMVLQPLITHDTKWYLVYLVHLDYKLNMLAAILAAILDSGDRIETPTSGMGLHPLITHTKWY